MTILESAVRNLLAQYPDILYGFADISYSPLAQEYSSALVLAVPHGKQLTPESYTESDFDAAICSSRDRLEAFLEKLESLLKEQKAVYYIPPMAQKNETDLLAEFSYKYAATRAGVGWIGRNDVVITERYGPRVRLSAVLINALFTYGEPITESRCPETAAAAWKSAPAKRLRTSGGTPVNCGKKSLIFIAAIKCAAPLSPSSAGRMPAGSVWPPVPLALRKKLNKQKPDKGTVLLSGFSLSQQHSL